jgi:hypothetical protein
MGLVDWVAALILDFVESHPWLDVFLESHFHALGLHGPLVRHSLRVRVVPAALLVTATLVLLIAMVVVRRTRRAIARRRAAAAA